MNKWRVSKSLKKVDLDVMPEYVKKIMINLKNG